MTLREWNLGSLDSVATWIGRTNAPPGSMALRGTVDCTWANASGETTIIRRFVVVRMVSRPEGMERAEYAIFVGRE